MKTEIVHFRVHTPNLLQDIIVHALDNKKDGILKIPLNVFQTLLAQVAERCAKINDPILNKLMFDLSLYELPMDDHEEYRKLMKRVYAEAEKQIKKEKMTTIPTN
jgi:hypothetical protein